MDGVGSHETRHLAAAAAVAPVNILGGSAFAGAGVCMAVVAGRAKRETQRSATAGGRGVRMVEVERTACSADPCLLFSGAGWTLSLMPVVPHHMGLVCLVWYVRW